MAWARHPIPQLCLHGVDSQATSVPHPAGLVHLRVVGFLAVFLERGARMASACTLTALENRGCSLLRRSSFSATLKKLRTTPKLRLLRRNSVRSSSKCGFQFLCLAVSACLTASSDCVAPQETWLKASVSYLQKRAQPLWHRSGFSRPGNDWVGIFRNRPLAPGVHSYFRCLDSQVLSARPHTGEIKAAAPRAIVSLDSCGR